MSSGGPIDWTETNLSGIASLQYGKSPKTVISENGNYPVIGTGGISAYANSFLHEGQTTVIGRKGTISSPQFISEKFWPIDTTYYVTDYIDTDPKWLYYRLTSIDFTKYNEASGVPSLSRDTLYSIKLQTPPLPEQKKIAAILSSVDAVIEKTQAQIDKLKDLKTGMVQELLTKGIGHTEFKDSPVGRIPAGWDILTMRDICSTRQGLQIPISNRFSSNADARYVYLTIKFINSGFDPSVAEYIEDPKPSVVCDYDDIILARTGATGKVVTGVKGVFHNNFFMVDYDRENVLKEYLVQYLNCPFIQNEISNRAGTTTIPDLNHGDFYSLPVPLPPQKEQKFISDTLSSIDVKIEKAASKLSSVEYTKKALTQDLLTGKVRVKVDAA
jgi:type I restriction enzyme S subunit